MAKVRVAQKGDAGFLFRMITMAAFPPSRFPLPNCQEASAYPHLWRWRSPLEREADFGVVIEIKRL
jgi:hypothetical protein